MNTLVSIQRVSTLFNNIYLEIIRDVLRIFNAGGWTFKVSYIEYPRRIPKGDGFI